MGDRQERDVFAPTRLGGGKILDLVLDAGVMLTEEQALDWVRRAGEAGPGAKYEAVALNVRG